MTIDQLTKEMGNQITGLSEGEFGEVNFDGGEPEQLPHPEEFTDPAPDIIGDVPERADDDWWNDFKNHHPLILGLYIPMRSPGQVVLFGNNLRLYYWSLIHHVVRPEVPYLTKLDLNSAWKLVLMKTQEHELFHHYSDVLRSIFATGLNSDIEEALAVAWARLRIQEERSKWQSLIGRMNGQVYSLLMRQAFAYRARGYRDWTFFADDVRFKPALLSYLNPNNHARLHASGVDMERLLYGVLGQVGPGGYIEKVR